MNFLISSRTAYPKRAFIIYGNIKGLRKNDFIWQIDNNINSDYQSLETSEKKYCGLCE